MAGRLIDAMTPGCPDPDAMGDLETWSRRERRRQAAVLGLDPKREVRSAVVERTIRREGYSIDVVRIEVIPGILLPANVYVPDGAPRRTAPLVLTPTGCGSSLWSPHVQKRAANLASLGMVTVVTAGFCRNGPRRELADSNPNLGYARQLVGLPGTVTFYLQELISTLTWAIASYPEVNPERIGVAGYSDGGHMALLLAAFDRRVASVSVPATSIGGSCEGPALGHDLWAASEGPDFVWSAPLELSVLPLNWRIALLRPRALHTTAGFGDVGAHPDDVGEAIAYARRIYGGGESDRRLSYRTDPDAHHYDNSRRQHTYEWLARTLLDAPGGPTAERDVDLVYHRDLAPDISASATLSAELSAHVETALARRFPGGLPAAESGERAADAVRRLFSDGPSETARIEPGPETTIEGVRLRTFRIDDGLVALPVFLFENGRAGGEESLLYLPSQGTRRELDRILRLLERYRTVVSIDHLGIGELESDRLLSHTVARYFMHNDPSLLQVNVRLLHAWLEASPPTAIQACSWGSSLYAAVLAHLEPENATTVLLGGVPDNELRHLASGERIPDPLLHGGLFSELTVAELAAGLGESVIQDPETCR
jgi:dienelactone hydrolase